MISGLVQPIIHQSFAETVSSALLYCDILSKQFQLFHQKWREDMDCVLVALVVTALGKGTPTFAGVPSGSAW